jgi:hypothetical protein
MPLYARLFRPGFLNHEALPADSAALQNSKIRTALTLTIMPMTQYTGDLTPVMRDAFDC